MDKDYRVEIRVKNNILWQAIHAGHVSVIAFCRRHGINNCDVYDYLNLKKTPVRLDGAWRRSVLKMAHALGITPENLFPPQHMWDVLIKNTAVVEMDYEDVQRLPMSAAAMLSDDRTPETDINEREIKEILAEGVELLPPRWGRIVSARYGLGGAELKTQAELADELNISTGRVQQIEKHALGRLSGKLPPTDTTGEHSFKQRAKEMKSMREK